MWHLEVQSWAAGAAGGGRKWRLRDWAQRTGGGRK
jgi:hypothetical protein